MSKYKYSILLSDSARNEFEEELDEYTVAVNKAICLTLDESMTVDQLIEYKGEDYYNLFYSAGTIGNSQIKGMLYFINSKISNSTINYLKTFCLIVNSYRIYNRYLNNIKPQNLIPLDYGVEQLINVFNFVTANTEFNINLEAKAGFEMGGHLSAGGAGLTCTVALTGFAELNYEAELIKDGFYTDLEDSDPLKMIQDEIADILTNIRSGKRIGALTAFSILK